MVRAQWWDLSYCACNGFGGYFGMRVIFDLMRVIFGSLSNREETFCICTI